MRKESLKMLLILMIIAVTSVTIMASTPGAQASTTSAQSRIFALRVGRNGINGTSGPLTITVQQGDAVKITFIYDDLDIPNDNPHIMEIDEYGVQTVQIGKSNPVTTIEFVADKAGTFSIFCNIPCLGMEKLQRGRLVVTQATQSSPQGATTIGLKVIETDPSANFNLISATVKDPNDRPIAGVPVKFYENTSVGKLLVQTAPTNSLGVAVLNYTSARIGNIEIIAEVSDPSYQGSRGAIIIFGRGSGTESGGKIYVEVKESTSRPSGFYGDIRQIMPQVPFIPNFSMIAVPTIMNVISIFIAACIILGVWSTYAYVARQIITLPKNAEEQAT